MANIFSKIKDGIEKASNDFGRALDNFTPLQSIGNGITGFVKGSIKSIPGAGMGALAGIGGGIPGVIAGAIAGGAPTVIKETVAGVSGGGSGSAVPSVLNGIAGVVGDIMSKQDGKVGEVGKMISSASDVVADSLLPKDSPGTPSVSGGVKIDLPGGGSVSIDGKTGSSGGSTAGSSSSGNWRDKYNSVTDELSSSVPIVYPFQRS